MTNRREWLVRLVFYCLPDDNDDNVMCGFHVNLNFIRFGRQWQRHYHVLSEHYVPSGDDYLTFRIEKLSVLFSSIAALNKREGLKWITDHNINVDDVCLYVTVRCTLTARLTLMKVSEVKGF